MLASQELEEFRAHTLEYSLAHGGVSYRAVCIPPEPGLNWSLSRLYTSEDAEQNPKLATRWGTILKRLGANRAYGPSVGFMSGEIVAPCAFTTLIPLPPGVCLYRNKDLPSEGTLIDPRESVIASMGGCACIVATGCGKCIVAHGGGASVMDMRAFGGKGHRRKHFSVVNALAETVRNLRLDPQDFRIDVLFALPKDEYGQPINHPVFGGQNRRVWSEYLSTFDPEVAEVRDNMLYINLGKLIAAQAIEAGFGMARSRCNLTTNHASTRHANPRMHDQRNAVIVVRTA